MIEFIVNNKLIVILVVAIWSFIGFGILYLINNIVLGFNKKTKYSSCYILAKRILSILASNLTTKELKMLASMIKKDWFISEVKKCAKNPNSFLVP